jgi:hypothetical protein
VNPDQAGTDPRTDPDRTDPRTDPDTTGQDGGPVPAGGEDIAGDGPDAKASSSLEAARQALRAVGELPVADRPAVFAAVNDAIAAELAAMEEA